MSEIPSKKQSKGNDKGIAASSPRRLDPVAVVESVIKKALISSADKMGPCDVKAIINCIKKGDPTACSYYHYNIARELGRVLGSWDVNIRAVYALGYDDNTSAEEGAENFAFSLVHMIIWAERKTKALNAMIEAIDRAMVQVYRKLFEMGELQRVVDIQVIDGEDVKNRTGYAALLKSIYQMPIQVWSSEAGKL